VIIAEIFGQLAKTNEELQTRKVPKADRVSKSIVMRRYIDKVQSPQCPIDAQVVTEPFVELWALPVRDFEEAD
jgi:hypothetical protein